MSLPGPGGLLQRCSRQWSKQRCFKPTGTGMSLTPAHVSVNTRGSDCFFPNLHPQLSCLAASVVSAELKREMERPKLPYSPGKKEDLGWRRHLPIRKLTEEEWEDYQRVRKQRFKDRCARGWFFKIHLKHIAAFKAVFRSGLCSSSCTPETAFLFHGSLPVVAFLLHAVIWCLPDNRMCGIPQPEELA